MQQRSEEQKKGNEVRYGDMLERREVWVVTRPPGDSQKEMNFSTSQ